MINDNNADTDDIDRLFEFVANTRESAEKIEQRAESGEIQNKDHANGVVTGLRWAADELAALLDECDSKTDHT